MRISTSQAYLRLEGAVGRAQERLDTSMKKSTTFKQINKPSDDPKGWVRSTGMRQRVADNEIIARNANLAKHFLVSTEDALSSLQKYVVDAHEMNLAVANTIGEKGHTAAISEAEGIKQNVIKALNAKFSNRFLFSGHKSTTEAFDTQGNFQGDSGVVKVENERGSEIRTNIDTRKMILGEGLHNGINIPQLFDDLIEGLKSGEMDKIRAPLDHFQDAVDQLSVARAQVGALMNTIERGVDAHETEKISTLDSASQIDEVNPGKAFVEMARDRVALQAAISSGSKILQELPKQLLLS